MLCFLETPVLRFDLLPYYRRNKRISYNVEKLTTVFDHHNDCVYNTVTKKILPEKFAKIFLNHEQEGAEKRLQKFTNDRIEGNISIWKPLKKTNYQHLMRILNLSREILMERQLDLKKRTLYQDRLWQLEADQRFT